MSVSIVLRDYQRATCRSVVELFNTSRRVCCVAPTGAGKTVIMSALIRHWLARNRKILVVVHRVELVDQILSWIDAGVIVSGRKENRQNPVQVATCQTLLARKLPPADVVIFDECHHYASDEWSTIAQAYPTSRILGFTATPTRSDGKPLGALFDSLVVAAHYPDLIRDGHLVPCRVIRPDGYLPSLAKKPLQAYLDHAQGQQAIVFCRLKESAKKLANEFVEAGISAAAVSSDTSTPDREQIIRDFKAGKIHVLTNVFCLTEGFDSTCPVLILARGVNHVSSYLQMCGRVLRPGPGKTHAVFIDLPGVSHLHGFPTQKRDYSLERGIVNPLNTKAVRVKDCPQCGNCVHPVIVICDTCGYVFDSQTVKAPKIFCRDLLEVWDGSQTPDDAKRRELERLRQKCRSANYNPAWIVRRYRELFGETPKLSDQEKRSSYQMYLSDARRRGLKTGSAYYKFRGVWNENPPRW